MTRGFKAFLIAIIFLVVFWLCLMFIPDDLFAGDLNASFSFGYDPDIDLLSVITELDYNIPLAKINDRNLSLDIYGGINILVTQAYKDNNPFSFQPQVNIYTFGAELIFDIYSIGWKHFCIHPGDFEYRILYNYDDMYLQGSDRFYFKVDTRYRLGFN